LVSGHAKSGMSIRAYCAKMRVKEPAFYWWRAELARRDAPTHLVHSPTLRGMRRRQPPRRRVSDSQGR
jgi:hypothetical protein